MQQPVEKCSGFLGLYGLVFRYNIVVEMLVESAPVSSPPWAVRQQPKDVSTAHSKNTKVGNTSRCDRDSFPLFDHERGLTSPALSSFLVCPSNSLISSPTNPVLLRGCSGLQSAAQVLQKRVCCLVEYTIHSKCNLPISHSPYVLAHSAYTRHCSELGISNILPIMG